MCMWGQVHLQRETREVAGKQGNTPKGEQPYKWLPQGQNGEGGGRGKDLGIDPSWVVENSYPYSHSQALKKF